MFISDPARRLRALGFVASIAKWSMADVFVVALFIAYLAAKATQSSGDPAAPPLVAFDARFGSGFYWFAAYASCLFARVARVHPSVPPRKRCRPELFVICGPVPPPSRKTGPYIAMLGANGT